MALHRRLRSILLLIALLVSNAEGAQPRSSSSFSAALQTLQKQLGQETLTSTSALSPFKIIFLLKKIQSFFSSFDRSYEFQSIDLLRRAMTHSSYSRENFRSLSILGLSVIQTSVSMKLLTKDLDVSAKEMNGKIADVSDVEGCTAAGSRLGLEKVVRVSERTNATAPAVVCGAFRAIFGGVAMDSGKVEVAGEVFSRIHGGGGFAAVD